MAIRRFRMSRIDRAEALVRLLDDDQSSGATECRARSGRVTVRPRSRPSRSWRAYSDRVASWQWVGGLVCVGLLTAACSSEEGSSTCNDLFFVGPVGDRLKPSFDVYAPDEREVRGDRLTADHASQQAAISPDGERMVVVSSRGYAFDSEMGPDATSLYVSEVDGDGERRLVTDHYDHDPVWSPDGTKIAFVRGHGPSKLLVIDVAQPDQITGVTTLAHHSADIAWLDDDTLSWWEDRSRRPAVLSRDANGDGPITVAVPAVPSDPVWNPDRTKIAYHTYIGQGRDQLVVRDLDTGQITVVPESDSLFTYPVAWTKADRLFFTRNAEGPDVSLKVTDNGGQGPSSVVGTTDSLTFDSINPTCD